MKKYLIAIIIAAAAVGGVYAYQHRYPTTGVRTAAPRPTEDQATDVKYRGQDGKNAFELLQLAAANKVEFKQYDFGVFIQSINGVKPDSKHFWKLYVNGQESQVGADKLATHNGDTIEWRVEEIK